MVKDMNTAKTAKTFELWIHFFMGVGAMAGGLGAVLNPTEPMGMSTEALQKGPFSDFLIPGLFLFLVIGVGNMIAGVIVKKDHKFWPYLSGALGAILVSWIVIQCIILQSVVSLHVIFFGIGCIQGLLALYYIWDKKLFLFTTNS